MHAVDRVDREAFEQSLLDHRAAATEPFFRRLEDEGDGAAEIRMLSQIACRAQQHGRVPVMPARMHLAGNLGAVLATWHFLDVERVEVGAQPDRTLARQAALQSGNDTCPGDPFRYLKTPLPQPFRDQRSRPGLLKPDLWVLVDVVTDRDQFGGVVRDGRDQIVLGHSVTSTRRAAPSGRFNVFSRTGARRQAVATARIVSEGRITRSRHCEER